MGKLSSGSYNKLADMYREKRDKMLQLEEKIHQLEQALDIILNVCDLWHNTHLAFPDLSNYRKLLKDKN